jgi:hypothetical protein
MESGEVREIYPTMGFFEVRKAFPVKRPIRLPIIKTTFRYHAGRRDYPVTDILSYQLRLALCFAIAK